MRTRASVAALVTISGPSAATTRWQKLASAAFCRFSIGSSPRPITLFQNERRSSTTVTKAMGAPVTVMARPARSSKTGSAAVSSRPLARTAANRTRSNT